MAEDIQKDKTAFSSGLGTAFRLNEDFAYINLALRSNNFTAYFNELQILFSDLFGLMSKISKEGKLENLAEYKEANTLFNNCLESYYGNPKKNIPSCLEVVKSGPPICRPSPIFIINCKEFDRYLRTCAVKYGLYMVMDTDDNETPSLVRKPIMNYNRRY